MGYERKRGKLTDLNRLLTGGINNNFSMIIGDPAIYSTIKYVITLDADTQLARDAAWQLVAAMAHPLTTASYSEKKKRVTDGYGILQPRYQLAWRDQNVLFMPKCMALIQGLIPIPGQYLIFTRIFLGKVLLLAKESMS